MWRNKMWFIFGMAVVFILLLIFIQTNSRTLDNILSSKHYYTNPTTNPEVLESIPFYELEEVKEIGKVNLEGEHTFEIKSGNEFSYEFLEDRGKYLVLKVLLSHNYSDNSNQFIVPSEIIKQNGSFKYNEPFQFKVFDSNGGNALAGVNEVDFGEYEILIDKEKAFNSLRLDIYLENYKLLTTD